jgi:hypothetical protein
MFLESSFGYVTNNLGYGVLALGVGVINGFAEMRHRAVWLPKVGGVDAGLRYDQVSVGRTLAEDILCKFYHFGTCLDLVRIGRLRDPNRVSVTWSSACPLRLKRAHFEVDKTAQGEESVKAKVNAGSARALVRI